MARRTLRAVLAGTVVAIATSGPSPGCLHLPWRERPAGGNRTVVVQEPELGPTERRYFVATAPKSMAPAPLLIALHGQSGTPESWGITSVMQQLAEDRGWALAVPAGIEEAGDAKDWDTGWNVGTGGDNSTCVNGTRGSNCMDSCRVLGRCGRCNWNTCHDDVAFIRLMLERLGEEYCLDTSRYYVLGESNGAMFTHYLIQQLPGRFSAAAPVFGQPLLGYLVGSNYQLISAKAVARRTSVLQLHGRSDVTIPWQGGISADGWLYESRDRSLGVWAALHDCPPVPTPVWTPYSGGEQNLTCFEFAPCESGGRVMHCPYDGGHGEWPDQPRAGDLILAFFEGRLPSGETTTTESVGGPEGNTSMDGIVV